MIGSSIITFFRGLIDNDSLDSDFEYSLMNAAKDKLESEREWEFLKKVDSSAVTTDSAITLPTDFYAPLYLFITGETQPYSQIPFEQATMLNSVGRCFYIDFANSRYYLLGSPTAGQTIYFYYLRQTDDLAAATSPVFPAKFHKILAYEMAKMYYAADQGNVVDASYNWSPFWKAEYESLRSRMIDWDNAIKKRAIENGYSVADMSAGVSYDSKGFYIGDI
jgi:hypothetical protein